ncbi:MAG: O-antigen ligase family protein [Flavobacteriaceae bacterium]
MKTVNSLNSYCLILSVFFLPISMKFNNIFLLLFIVLGIGLMILQPKKNLRSLLKKNLGVLLITSLPFWLNVLGLLYTDELKTGTDYTIRALPFLFLPLIAISIPDVFRDNYKKMGYALVVGCVIVAVYSWFVTLVEIYQLNRPMKELFGPLHSHHKLVKSLDLHASYLSIFIYTAIGFIISQKEHFSKRNKVVAVLGIIFLTAFLFHLLSRNAIAYFLMVSFVYLLYNKQWKVLLGTSVLIIALGYMAYNVNHNYLRDRIFNNLNFFEKETRFSKKDDRFERLSASYEIFLKKPIIGFGTAAESKHRTAVFKKNKDMVAYNENYNAHNQFFEYLSTFGVVGGVSYFIFFGYLFFITLKHRNGFLMFMVLGLFLACITESIFERSLGAVFSALLIAILLSYEGVKIIPKYER